MAADADGDGMPNRWERTHGLNPNKDEDTDEDGLADEDEDDQGGDDDGVWYRVG